MAIDLINIDNLVLADDFESWFKRTNEVIDALNQLQLYDFYDNFYATGDGVFPTVPGYTTVQDITEATTLGLKITRDIRFLGDMLIEILPEPPLGFDITTGRLTFVFTGPNAPPLLGTSCTPPDSVDRLDRYIVWDDSASVTKVVEAQKMLPLIIECDHQFGEAGTPVTITIKGDLVVDGNQTILNTTTVESLDNKIDLNATPAFEIDDSSNYVGGEDLVVGETVTGQTSGETAIVFSWTPATVGNPGSKLVVTNRSDPFTAGEVITGGISTFSITENGQVDAPGIPAGNDATANNGGICVLSSDLPAPYGYGIQWKNAGDRWFINDAGWEIDPAFSLFTTTIEPQNNNLDLLGAGSDEAVSLHWHELFVADHWRLKLRAFNTTGQVGYTLGSYPVGGELPLNDDGVFVLQHSTADDTSPSFDLEIFFDSVTPTHDGQIFGFARNLNADLLDGCHASFVSLPFAIPCADANGEIDPDFIPFTGSTVKQIIQTAHGFVVGNVVRIEKGTSTGYILAQANTEERAEAVGVVETIIDANEFDLNMRGCIEATTLEWDAVTGDTGGLLPGGVYFLHHDIAGFMTLSDPIAGDVSKTMMVAIDATTAIVMNYVGGLTDPTQGVPTIDLSGDVIGLGLLGSTITTVNVERTDRRPNVLAGATELLIVEHNDITGTGFRTFEITLTGAGITLELQQPPLAPSIDPVTNSVTLIIHQDPTGGWTPNITISGGGSIAWDNSIVQPAIQTAPNKTTVYVLVNVNDVPGVWFGSRAVFEL